MELCEKKKINAKQNPDFKYSDIKEIKSNPETNNNNTTTKTNSETQPTLKLFPYC